MTVSGGNIGGATPVPIPNTAVKTSRADGTAGETLWESRTPPGFLWAIYVIVVDGPLFLCPTGLARGAQRAVGPVESSPVLHGESRTPPGFLWAIYVIVVDGPRLCSYWRRVGPAAGGRPVETPISGAREAWWRESTVWHSPGRTYGLRRGGPAQGENEMSSESLAKQAVRAARAGESPKGARGRLAGCVAALAVVGCGGASEMDVRLDGSTDADGNGASGGNGGTGPQGPRGGGQAGAQPCAEMDIMFVIDNSLSMADEQANLAANFPLFVKALDEFGADRGVSLDYRIAVTTTAVSKTWKSEAAGGVPSTTAQVGDDGAVLQRCDMVRPWIEKGDPNRADTFACAAQIGTGGPLWEMPLDAVRKAVTERVDDGTNRDFFRRDAVLSVVILTDEDDCSTREEEIVLAPFELPCGRLSPVDDYAAVLDAATEGRGRWAVAAIAGTEPTACVSAFGQAAEAVRLRDFVGLAGNNGVMASICEGNLTGGLTAALDTFQLACNEAPPVIQ
jgi:hypothetical protein